MNVKKPNGPFINPTNVEKDTAQSNEAKTKCCSTSPNTTYSTKYEIC